jgi:parvulin-like peptidyl-prolyl isomerase
MLFQHINYHADKHRKRVYLVLVAVIGLSFVIFMGPKGCSQPGDRGKREIGVMFGKKVTLEEYRLAYRETDLANIINTGRSVGDGQQAVMPTVRRLQALHEARKLKLDAVSDQEFIEYVKTRPVFKKDGVFDKETLDKVRESLLNQKRMTGADFDRVLRDSIVVERVEKRALNGIVVSPTEVHDNYIRSNEKFGISYAKVDINGRGKDGDPLDADLQAHFAAHKGEFLLPASKVVRVISFPLPKPPDAKSIPEEKLKERFESLKKTRLFKGQTFEQARARVLKTVVAEEPRKQAMATANAVRDALKARPADGSLADLAKLADDLEKEHGGESKDSKPFLAGAKILPDFPKLRQLPQLARLLSAANPVPAFPFVADKACHLPIFLKTVPGGKAEELEPVRAAVVEAVVAEKAMALFKEKTSPHAADLEGMVTFDQQAFAGKQLEDSDAKTTAARTEVWENAKTFAKRYLAPGFKPEQRTAWVAQFLESDVKDKAAEAVTKELVRAYFDDNPDEYKVRAEDRVRKILLRVPRDADDEAKAEARKKADGILARIQAGESFEQIAKDESDETWTKDKGGDMGFTKKGTQGELDEAIEALAVGELSDVVETSQGLAILKLTDRRKGVPFEEEARKKIREKLVKEQVETMVKDQAQALSKALVEAFDKSVAQLPENAAEKVVSALAERTFKKIAAEKEIDILEVKEPFGPMDTMKGVSGGGYTLRTSVLSLALHSPFSDPVEDRGNRFVAMLTGIFPGRLYDPVKEKDIVVDGYSNVVRTDNARAVAEAKAKALRAAYAAAKDGDTPEDEKTKLKSFEPFTRMEAASMNNSRDQRAYYRAMRQFMDLPQVNGIMKEIDKARAKPGDLLGPVEGERAYVVVRIDSRTLPEEDGFDEVTRKQHEYSLRQIKVATAIGVFYDRLGKEANATLFGKDYSGTE